MGAVNAMAYSDRAAVFTGGDDCVVRAWDVVHRGWEGGKEVQVTTTTTQQQPAPAPPPSTTTTTNCRHCCGWCWDAEALFRDHGLHPAGV